MRARGEGTTPYPLLSAESFRNVLHSESVIAEVETPISLRRRAYIIRYRTMLPGFRKECSSGEHYRSVLHTKFPTDTQS